MKHALILAAAIIAGATTATRADEPSAKLEGTWEGFLKPAPILEIRTLIRVEKGPGGTYKAKAESPDFKPNPAFEFESVTIAADGAAVLTSKATGREFRGKLGGDGREIVGRWKKDANEFPLTLAKLDGPPVPSEIWEGPIELPGGISLKVVFFLGKLKDGTPRGTMDSPDQGSFGLKLDSVERDKDKLHLTIKALMGEFDGKPDAAGTSAAGQWKQGGASLPLTLKKVERVSEAKRTQMPRPPFPYATEEVAYDSKAPGVKLAGTLSLPPGPGPFAAVLLISGSGSQDRDESLLGHKPFLVLADDLTRRGIAVLRVDDRGTARSTGDFAKATTFDFADDAEAGFEYLRGRKQIAPGKIGLIGHSEGGVIAPIVAARTPEVGFIVLLAGTGLPGDQILIAQQRLILKATGVDDAKVKETADAMTRMIAVIKATPDPKEAEAKLLAVRKELVETMTEADRKALAESDPNGANVTRLATPWFRTFLLFDPRPTLAKVRCPVLAINGELDLQVPCKDNLDAIAKALASGGNARLTSRAMPGLNHLFQAATTGAPSEYAAIEETINPAALKVIGDWVVEQAGVR